MFVVVWVVDVAFVEDFAFVVIVAVVDSIVAVFVVIFVVAGLDAAVVVVATVRVVHATVIASASAHHSDDNAYPNQIFPVLAWATAN
jgi:hypothetical protein